MIWLDVDAALAEVPVNCLPLIDDTDFKTRETAVAYNAAGMDLVWNFVTTGGSFTQTAVTPTSGGDYDWTHQGDGMYSIEIPASGGASINNDTEGFGWFTGYATGVLPWRGPTIGFRAAALNDALVDSPWSATRGLAGTALPNAAADAAGGLPISDAGGLDLDAKLANTHEVTAARMGALTDWINNGRLDLIIDDILARIGTVIDLGSGTTLARNFVDTFNVASATDATATGLASDMNTLLTVRLTAARAEYLDNLNAGGVVASQADIAAINQSASRRVLLTTSGQFERPESGSSNYWIEARLYDGDGAPVNNDSGDPTLTATGIASGSLSGNLSLATNVATGHYRWAYNVESADTIEQIRFDIATTIGGGSFPLSVMSQVVDFVAAEWTTTDQNNLTAIFNKLPSRNYLAGSTVSTGAAVTTDLGLSAANLDTRFDDVDSGIDTLSLTANTINTKLGSPAGASVSADIAALNTLVNDIPTNGEMAGVLTMGTRFLTMIQVSSGSIYQFTADAVELAPSGGGGGGGSGARSVAVTVDDGTDPLESARVRVTKGAETYVLSTDVNGECSFSLDDGTWAVAVTLAGYSFTPTTLVVNGDETVTYSMSLIAIAPPAHPDAISAVYVLLDGGLANESGVTIYWRMIAPDEGAGIGFEQVWNESVTNGSGIATFAVIPGAEYEFAIAALTGCKFRYLIPDDAVNGHLISPKTVWQQ